MVRAVEQRQPFLHRVGEAGARFGTRPPRSRRVRLALQIGLVVLVFGFLVLTVVNQWSEIQSEGVHFHVGWLVPAILILPFYFLLSALGWDLILRALGYPIGFGRAQVAWGQPLLARYVPGSVLYVLGRVLLSERAGVPRRITIASVVYEQAISATSAVVIAAYFIISHPDLQGQPARWAVLLLIPAAIALLHPRVFGPLCQPGAGAFGREPLPAVISLRGVIGLILFYLLNWLVIAVGIYCVARSVTFVSASDILLLGSAQAIGYVAALATLVAPGRPRGPRRRLRLGGEGGAAGTQLRRRLADRDRRARRAHRRRTHLRRRRHRARAARGLEHRHRDPAPVRGGARGGPGGRRPHAGGPL